jgi:hypothetical protein
MAEIEPKIQVTRPISLLEKRRFEDDYEKERGEVGFFTAGRAAFAEENTMSWVFNGLPGYEPDPNFEVTDENYDRFTKDIPQEYHDFLYDAVSETHAEKLRERTLASLKNEEKLARYGWGSIPLRMAASIIDPAAIVATVATEGVAAPAIWGGKLTRLQRAFRVGLATSASSASIEAFLVSQNAIKDPYDILYAAGGGLILGTGADWVFGKKSAMRYQQAGAKIMKDAEQAQLADLNQAMLDRNIDTGIGAMENPMSPPNQMLPMRQGADVRIEDVQDAPMASHGKIRFDMAGEVKSSPLATSRDIGGKIAEDGVDPDRQTADLIKTTNLKATTVQYYQVYDPAYAEWGKRNNINAAYRAFNYGKQKFGELVSDEVEVPGSVTDEAVIRAADRHRKLMAKILNDMKAANVKGADDIPEDLTYFTRLWDGALFRKAREDFGDDGVIEVLAKSFKSANRGVSDDVANAVARGMTKNIRKRHAGMNAGISRIFSTSDKETLRDLLLEEELVTEADADRLISQLSVSREGISPRLKERLKFDMNTSIRKGEKTLHVKDLAIRDAEAVYNIYNNHAQGRIALAKVGIYSDADFQRYLNDIREEGDQFFGKKRAIAQDYIFGKQTGPEIAERDIARLQVMYDLILGRHSPLIGDPSSKGNRMARLVMDLNFVRLMNQVGFAQMSELGNALSIDGIKGMMRVIPEFRSMIKRAKNGELEDPVMRDLEAWTGVGVDAKIHNSMNRYSYDDMYVAGNGDKLDKALTIMQPLKRAGATVSGLLPINTLLERAAARIATQSLTDLAFGAKKIRFKRLGNTTLEQDIAARMKSLGFDEDMSQRVFDQIRKNAVTRDSVFFKTRKLKAINLDNWDDVEAAESFAYAISRWARQSIQQNDIGNLNIHMTSTLGKIFTQFRAFTLVSHAKQFLYGIRRRDFASFQAMAYSSIFAGAAYTLQTNLNSLGREDREEYLAERLTAAEIGKAAFARSTWAAILPGLTDTFLYAVGEDQMFGYTRSSGLTSNFWKGNPTVDFVDKSVESIRGGFRAAFNEDYQWSKGQQRALNSLLPFQNAIGIKNVLNMMMMDLPDKAKLAEE